MIYGFGEAVGEKEMKASALNCTTANHGMF